MASPGSGSAFWSPGVDRLVAPALRLFHTSDTHLGHSQYARTDAAGLNQRAQDIAQAFLAVIERAVAERPHLVLHAGDLFDGVRPGNRALATAMEGFARLARAGIPTVVIAGNHEHPKLRETGSPFRIFDGHLPGVHFVYKGARETLRLQTPAGPVRVHAVPQCQDNATLAREIQEAPVEEDGLDLLVAHGGVASLPAFSHAEANELTLEPSWFRPFHYVALGHYHGAQEVAPNAWYCGAPERVSIAEAGQEKGFLDVLVTREAAKPAFRGLPTRPYHDLPALECAGRPAEAIQHEALGALARVPDGAVARLRLKALDPSLRGGLDLRALRQAGDRLVHLEVRPEWADGGLDVRGTHELGGVAAEFDAFAAQQPVEGLDRARLLELAHAALRGDPL